MIVYRGKIRKVSGPLGISNVYTDPGIACDIMGKTSFNLRNKDGLVRIYWMHYLQ